MERRQTETSFDFSDVEAFLDCHPDLFEEYLVRRAKCDQVSSQSSMRRRALLRKASSLPPTTAHILSALLESRVNVPQYASSAIDYKYRLKETNEREFFLELVKDISNELDLTNLSYKILINVCILVDADRCSLFLVEGPAHKRTLVSKFFDVHSGTTVRPSSSTVDSNEVQVPWGKGIIGYVAEHGETVNISNAYEDHRFSDEIDKLTGYKTQTILCMAICNSDGEVIGVVQAINKNPMGIHFNEDDEKVQGSGTEPYSHNQVVNDLFEEQTDLEKIVRKIMQRALTLLQCERCSVLLLEDIDSPRKKSLVFYAQAFVIFCGLGINNTMMYNQVKKTWAKQSVALDMLSYHATSCVLCTPPFCGTGSLTSWSSSLKAAKIPLSNELGIDEFYFNDFSLDNDAMITAALRMFQDLGVVQKFKIDYEVLCRWLLTVRKNYRTVAYHNWRHAFNVSQCMFTMIKTANFQDVLADAEILALMVGCLCHDLDHRGTNNATGSALALLYGTSATLEHHHFNHAVMILQSEGHNIFANLSSKEYMDFWKLMTCEAFNLIQIF
uniref:3',5'-cyclic-GMP phosphodiesterase n=1 Tax=Oryzias latipes TaxID=8090 RepID=A0A3P9MCE1_ORYLA